MKTICFLNLRFSVAVLSLSLLSLAVKAQSTAPVLTAYYSVKDALVATDAGKAKTGATTLLSTLDKVDATTLSPADKKALVMAKTQAAAISKTTDVEKQREQFESLSANMITLVKATKPAKAFVQYCPMVDASWLSDSKIVKNPYYGDKMLKCGSVKEEL